MPESDAVAAAKARRAVANTPSKDEWYVDRVANDINLTMLQRMQLATSFLRDRIVKNISVPVLKVQGTTGVRVVQRSIAGEFPRADTTLLMKTITSEAKTVKEGVNDGSVGTPLDYGVILETSVTLNRSFLRRTFNEELPRLKRMLVGKPIE